MLRDLAADVYSFFCALLDIVSMLLVLLVAGWMCYTVVHTLALVLFYAVTISVAGLLFTAVAGAVCAFVAVEHMTVTYQPQERSGLIGY